MPVKTPFVVALLLLAVGVTACAHVTAPQQAAGRSGSISVSLKTVPIIRSVTISPSHATFVNCKGGDGGVNTRSERDELGFPNGSCQVSATIVIMNTGIASDIDVSGSDAEPADGMAGWTLCNTGHHAAVECTGDKHRPGPDQYKVVNFGTFGAEGGGITDTPQCDRILGPLGNCWATQGLRVTEGIRLIGPEWSSDISTNWTVTVTWTPVPGREH
jgi:hypothetical protein